MSGEVGGWTGCGGGGDEADEADGGGDEGLNGSGAVAMGEPGGAAS